MNLSMVGRTASPFSAKRGIVENVIPHIPPKS
jgi:hypothetical protein